ncbi:MAG: VOC family protein [Chitinophagia bacterium]|nr:VOC family protein [Chitinophagia bacterium]
MSQKVTGIGGVFIKYENPEQIKEWYKTHLGFNVDAYGATFVSDPAKPQQTIWSPFKSTTKYIEPSTKEFMINLRVENLEYLLDCLNKDGIMPLGEMQVFDFGKFAHIMDPEGVKIELWEPVNSEQEKTTEESTVAPN